jgi:hypothetical protein
MNNSNYKFVLGRYARDIQATLKYPLWNLQGRPAPDNHLYKKNRIKRLAEVHNCETFIETGTYYGQMVNFAQSLFSRVISIEIYEPFFNGNIRQFSGHVNTNILLGDSGKNLPEAINQSSGRILFWLDGHYSGSGTGIGEKVSPVIEELRLIAKAGRKDDCIIIDDRRLFSGSDGYPTINETIEELKKINPKHNISYDQDSIVVEPA